MINNGPFIGDEKWNTVLINPGTVEVLDENKKTVLKAKTKERILKKQERDFDPKIIPKEKSKLYDGKTKQHKTSTEDEEKEENPETIVIIKKQEISREFGESSNPNMSAINKKKVQYEKYVDNPDKYLKQKKTVMTTLIDEKTEKPDFKLSHGKDYVEKQKTTTYSTEITPAKNPKLNKLEDRDEYMFSNIEAEKEFKKNERKNVKERRDKYSNREKAKVREVVTTDIQERKLRATMMIQKWFKNRQSILLKAGDQQKSVLPTKIINYEINKNLDSSEQFDSKKKERRKRDKRKKINNSFSQNNIELKEKTSEEALFKNKLLTQSFRQSDSGIKETEKNNEENNKNLRDELKKALEKRNLLEEKIQEEQIALTNSKKKNEDIIEKDKKNLMASNKIENDKFEAKENIDYISASEPKKKAVFLHVNDQADDLEKKITIEKRRKTGGMPLKNKKMKRKDYSSRYDINAIREMEKEAATIIQVFYRYHLKKKNAENSSIKCHKATQVEIDLLYPTGVFQNLNNFLKDPKNPSNATIQALSILIFSMSKSLTYK